MRQSFSVNIKGGGLATTLDFGTLTTRAHKDVYIEARGNQAYTLKIRSDNGGVMVLTPPMPGKKWTLPYTATLNNAPVNFNGVNPTAVGPFDSTRPRYDAEHKLGISIDKPTNQRAGTYKDVITIEIGAAIP